MWQAHLPTKWDATLCNSIIIIITTTITMHASFSCLSRPVPPDTHNNVSILLHKTCSPHHHHNESILRSFIKNCYRRIEAGKEVPHEVTEDRVLCHMFLTCLAQFLSHHTTDGLVKPLKIFYSHTPSAQQ